MDAPQNDPSITSAGTMAAWAVTGAIAAGLSSLRRKVSMAVATFHVALASFICSCAPYAVLAFWPQAKWYVGIPISMAIGLTIYGVSIMLDKTNKRIEDIDPTKYLPDKLRPPDGGAL